jgi:D-amino peptidase
VRDGTDSVVSGPQRVGPGLLPANTRSGIGGWLAFALRINQEALLRVFISVDMEGTAGVVDWPACVGDGPEAMAGRELLLGEVNAAIDGAVRAGATDILVNDGHAMMRNLAADRVHGDATVISGWHRPDDMMEGIDESFDAALLVSYHGSMGHARSNMSHSFNPRAVSEVLLNGAVVGESVINSLVAAHYGVPVVLVTGDDAGCEETVEVLPHVTTAVVKRSITRHAAASLHPRRARELITEAAERSVAGRSSVPAHPFPTPSTLTVTWRTPDMADMASWVRGVDRSGPRTTTITHSDLLTLYRCFIAAITVTRVVAEDV